MYTFTNTSSNVHHRWNIVIRRILYYTIQIHILFVWKSRQTATIMIPSKTTTTANSVYETSKLIISCFLSFTTNNINEERRRSSCVNVFDVLCVYNTIYRPFWKMGVLSDFQEICNTKIREFQFVFLSFFFFLQIALKNCEDTKKNLYEM